MQIKKRENNKKMSFFFNPSAVFGHKSERFGRESNMSGQYEKYIY